MTPAEFTNVHPALAEFWHPVALSADIGTEPAAAALAGQGWALARLAAGMAAFADSCPHRRARLSAGSVTGGTLQCTYHGWRFGPDGRCVDIPALGDAAQIPARATLRRPAGVTEHDGLVWLAPGTPRAPLPDLAPDGSLAGESMATVALPVLHLEANAAMLIDNFLDEAHLPFVHAATIGGAGPEVIPRADVVRDGLSFTAVREHTFTNLTDPAVRDGSRPAVQRRRMTYRYQAPLTATLLLEYLDAGGWQFLTFVVTPADDRQLPGLPDRHRPRPRRRRAGPERGQVRDDDLRGRPGPAAPGTVRPGIPPRPGRRAAHQGRPGFCRIPPGSRRRRGRQRRAGQGLDHSARPAGPGSRRRPGRSAGSASQRSAGTRHAPSRPRPGRGDNPGSGLAGAGASAWCGSLSRPSGR